MITCACNMRIDVLLRARKGNYIVIITKNDCVCSMHIDVLLRALKGMYINCVLNDDICV